MVRSIVPWCVLVLGACGAGSAGGGGGEATSDSAFGAGGTGGDARASGDAHAGGHGGGPSGGMADSAVGPGPVDAGPVQDRTAPLPDRDPADAQVTTPDAASACPDGGVCAGPCVLDTDCPGTRSCVDGICPEPDRCFAPEDCDAPGVCAAGICSPPCARDADCAGEQVCDLALGGCVTPLECAEDSDCPGSRVCVDAHCPEPALCFGPDDCDAGRACREGTCEAACGDAAPCAGRLVCDAATSLCHEGDGCADAGDCLHGRVCDAGLCTEPCVDDLSCMGSRHCDLVTGLCPEPAECLVPQDCDAARLCLAGRCADGCNEVAPCPGNQRCDLMNGVCVEPEVCQDDADCPRGVCDAGACHPPCNSDPDCGGAATCDLQTGRCRSAAVCTVDADCAGLEICGVGGGCFRPDCETNADCAGACVDQLCADAAPTACGAVVPCAAPQLCAPAGVCALAGACEGDLQCPTGAPRCDLFDGQCQGCLDDGDCAGAEFCQGGTCVLGRACGVDDDCPGDRTCIAGLCLLGGICDGDRFDHNPAIAQLTTRTYTGLVLCDGDEDAYDLSVPAEEGVRVVLRYDPAAGDLSATLVDPTAMPPLTLHSDLREGVEIVGVADAALARSLTLRIQGRPGRSVPYSLTLERLEPGVCVADALEGVLGNNDAQHAHALGLSEAEVELCPGDEDWLSLDLPAGTHLDLRATTLAPGATVEMTLTGPGGGRLGRETATAMGGVLSVDVVAGGRHLVQLRGAEPDTRTRLRLSVELRPTTELAACTETLRLVPGDPLQLPLRLPVRRFSMGCGVGTDPDVLLEFTLPSPSMVDLTTVGASVVAVRADCADVGSEAACDASAPPALRGLRLEAGTWFVVLKVVGAGRPSVTLAAAPLCAVDGDCGLNGLCVAGACQARCVRDPDCPGTQVCDRGSGRCRESGLCTIDGDCLAGRQCRFDGTCFVANCVENSDCDGACVDETCAAAAPTECVGDAECPGSQVCSALGACAQLGPCGDDVDCPAGTPACDLGTSQCVACLSQDQCQPGEDCRAGRCEFLGACEGPGDCPGTRICGNDNLCRAAPGCMGDRFDGLEAPATLAARTYSGLLLCDGAQDTYVVEPRPGEGLRVILRHDPRLGDLALTLSALPPLLDRFGASDGLLGVESVSLPAAELIRPALLRITGRPGAAVPYTLTIERTAADVCTADALEGVLGNDALETAVALPAGPQTLSLCSGDEDWFTLRVSAGTHLTARVTPDDLLLSLHDEVGALMAEGESVDGRVVLAGDFVAPVDAHLRLRAPDAVARRSVGLQVEATAAPGAEAVACSHPLQLVPNQLLAPPDALRVARFAVSCAFPFPGLTGDFVAQFRLAAPGRVTLEPSDGSAVALRTNCADPASEFVCGLAHAEVLTDVALAAGTYFVVVQAFSPTPPQLRMTVR